jgi:anti-anti-sigma factor
MAFSTTTTNAPLTASHWIQDVSNAAKNSNEPEIVVDMSSVNHVRSQELNELIQLQRELNAQGRKLILENTLDHIAQVFSITRLDRVLELREQQLA